MQRYGSSRQATWKGEGFRAAYRLITHFSEPESKEPDLYRSFEVGSFLAGILPIPCGKPPWNVDGMSSPARGKPQSSCQRQHVLITGLLLDLRGATPPRQSCRSQTADSSLSSVPRVFAAELRGDAEVVAGYMQPWLRHVAFSPGTHMLRCPLETVPWKPCTLHW